MPHWLCLARWLAPLANSSPLSGKKRPPRVKYRLAGASSQKHCSNSQLGQVTLTGQRKNTRTQTHSDKEMTFSQWTSSQNTVVCPGYSTWIKISCFMAITCILFNSAPHHQPRISDSPCHNRRHLPQTLTKTPILAISFLSHSPTIRRDNRSRLEV